MKKIFTLMFAAIALWGCQSGKNEEELNIACNLPMTGYIGMYGDWIKSGMEFARQDAVAKLDSLGLSINIDYQDNKGVTKDCISISQKHLTEKPDIYMSGVTSQTMAIKDKILAAKIPHVVWSFTPLFLEEDQMNFRTWVNYGEEAKHYVEFCKMHEAKKIAILFIDLVGAKEQTVNYIIPKLKEYDSSIEFLVDEFPVDYSNFKSNIIKIKDFNPDVILVSGFKGNMVNIIREVEAYKIDKSKIMCSMDLMDTASGALSVESLEGLSVSARAFSIDNMQTPEMKKWMDRFQSKFGRAPEYMEAFAYDTFNMIVEAFNNCDGDKSKMNEELLNLKMQGVNGSLNFLPNGELNNQTYISVYRNGRLQAI